MAAKKVPHVEAASAPVTIPVQAEVLKASAPVKGRPIGAPPAADVIQEYETSTHRIYKLRNHRKVAIAKV